VRRSKSKESERGFPPPLSLPPPHLQELIGQTPRVGVLKIEDNNRTEWPYCSLQDNTAHPIHL